MINKPKLSYIDLLNEYSTIKIHHDKLKKENKELRKLIEQWTQENKTLQQSLDDAQEALEVGSNER